MIAKAYFAVAAQQVTTHQINLIKLEVTLNSNATAGLFLQIHDSNVAAANGAVPVKSWPAGECAYKEFERGELTLGLGCYICLSTTAATKTLAAGGSDLMDVLQVEEFYPEYPTGTTFVGDITDPVQSLQVWSEADGLAARKGLISLEVDGTGLVDFIPIQYIMIFTKDTVHFGDVPLPGRTFPIAYPSVLTGEKKFTFGIKGLNLFTLSGTPPTASYGCKIVISQTGNAYSVPVGNVKMVAEYKNL